MGVTKNSAAYCCTGAVANGCEQMHALMCMSTRTHNSSHITCELFGDRIHGGGGDPCQQLKRHKRCVSCSSQAKMSLYYFNYKVVSVSVTGS